MRTDASTEQLFDGHEASGRPSEVADAREKGATSKEQYVKKRLEMMQRNCEGRPAGTNKSYSNAFKQYEVPA
jgi:hypothetical protein